MIQPTRLQFCSDIYFCAALAGSPFVIHNGPEQTIALIAWMAEEGSVAHWNPFDTTERVPGSTDLPGNTAGVQVYPTEHDGLLALFTTLEGAAYGGIRWALDYPGSSAEEIALQVARSPWGTWRNDPSAAANTVGIVRSHFCNYAAGIVH